MDICLSCGGHGEVQYLREDGSLYAAGCPACRGVGQKRALTPRVAHDPRESLRAAQEAYETHLHRETIRKNQGDILNWLALVLDGGISRGDFFANVDELVQQEASAESEIA